jgi:hypothetical protein
MATIGWMQERKAFFFEKKKQKTFDFWVSSGGCRVGRSVNLGLQLR